MCANIGGDAHPVVQPSNSLQTSLEGTFQEASGRAAHHRPSERHKSDEHNGNRLALRVRPVEHQIRIYEGHARVPEQLPESGRHLPRHDARDHGRGTLERSRAEVDQERNGNLRFGDGGVFAPHDDGF